MTVIRRALVAGATAALIGASGTTQGGTTPSGATQSGATRGPVSPAPSPELTQALAGRVAGKPVNCITASRVSEPDIVDQNNIIYRETRSRLWHNQLSDKCAVLRDNDILVVERFGDQLCRYDRFRTVNRNSGLGSAYCILGTFTPYDVPKDAPKR